MGDMADYYGEQYDYFDDRRWDEDPRQFRRPIRVQRTPKTCKYCGTANLKWLEIETGWRLHTMCGKIHICEERLNGTN